MASRDQGDAPVWLITGAGRGLGRAFAEAALASGARVIGTVRTEGAFSEVVAAHPHAAHELVLDVRDREAVSEQIAGAGEVYGRLDVVVNNAGYGLVGAIEELGEDEVRAQVDTNLLGAIWVTQDAITQLRAAGGGEIVQISTVGAVGSMATFGLYNASKWGLEGFSEALAQEVSQFGIGVTIAQLGGFDTDWGGSSLQFAEPLPHYDELRTGLFGSPEVPWPPPDPSAEPTDAPPQTAAAALLAHLARPADERPLRVLIGDDAPGQASAAYEARRDSYGKGSRLSWPSAPATSD